MSTVHTSCHSLTKTPTLTSLPLWTWFPRSPRRTCGSRIAHHPNLSFLACGNKLTQSTLWCIDYEKTKYSRKQNKIEKLGESDFCKQENNQVWVRDGSRSFKTWSVCHCSKSHQSWQQSSLNFWCICHITSFSVHLSLCSFILPSEISFSSLF